MNKITMGREIKKSNIVTVKNGKTLVINLNNKKLSSTVFNLEDNSHLEINKKYNEIEVIE